MPFYVYVIQSLSDNSFYKGFSEDYAKRLLQHNNAECAYTSLKIPWKLVYAEEHLTKRSALIREKNLKKATRERIVALIKSDKNLFNR